jgi:hypothetical protein
MIGFVHEGRERSRAWSGSAVTVTSLPSCATLWAVESTVPRPKLSLFFFLPLRQIGIRSQYSRAVLLLESNPFFGIARHPIVLYPR